MTFGAKALRPHAQPYGENRFRHTPHPPHRYPRIINNAGDTEEKRENFVRDGFLDAKRMCRRGSTWVMDPGFGVLGNFLNGRRDGDGRRIRVVFFW